MATATLTAIRTKVRRLSRSLSTAQLSNADIDEYVNTFIAYDFPEHLRLSLPLRETFEWYCQPDIYQYDVNTANAGLANFFNNNITVHPPVYVAGKLLFYTQDKEEFLTLYPEISSVVSTGLVGDGVTAIFAGTLASVPVLRRNVLFSTKDNASAGLYLVDQGDGTLAGDGVGTINYLTGAYTLNFSANVLANEIIYSQTVPYSAGIPQAMLFFGDSFFLRPVPDKVYTVKFTTFQAPTELINAGDVPQLDEWWQYIAYGAAKKVFEDRSDLDSVQALMPEFKTQERLILRRALVQQSNERVATIYTENGANFFNPGSGFNNYN